MVTYPVLLGASVATQYSLSLRYNEFGRPPVVELPSRHHEVVFNGTVAFDKYFVLEAFDLKSNADMVQFAVGRGYCPT